MDDRIQSGAVGGTPSVRGDLWRIPLRCSGNESGPSWCQGQGLWSSGRDYRGPDDARPEDTGQTGGRAGEGMAY